jgi:hypothetical protein
MNRRQVPMRSIFVLSLYLSLAACSGGNEGGNARPPPPRPPPPPTCDGVGLVSSTRFPIVTEIEPNNDLSTAFGVSIPTPAPDQSVGLLVGGSVYDSLDQVDTISFTSTRTIEFIVKLCEDICNSAAPNDKDGNPDSLDLSIAYFDVLDAAGSVVGSSRNNASTENYAGLRIEGGVITYVQVFARDTLSATQKYKLTAFKAL